MIGLNASGNNSTSGYTDIDYSLYFDGNSVLYMKMVQLKAHHLQ